jgi:hypothetical protein
MCREHQGRAHGTVFFRLRVPYPADCPGAGNGCLYCIELLRQLLHTCFQGLQTLFMAPCCRSLTGRARIRRQVRGTGKQPACRQDADRQLPQAPT